MHTAPMGADGRGKTAAGSVAKDHTEEGGEGRGGPRGAVKQGMRDLPPNTLGEVGEEAEGSGAEGSPGRDRDDDEAHA